jgi:hypothetical protein
MVMADVRYLMTEAASKFLFDNFGLRRSPKTLSKLRCVGGGPVFQAYGRTPVYTPARLTEYALSLLSPERASTSTADKPERRLAANDAATAATASPAPRRRGRRRKARDDARGEPAPLAAGPGAD